ncbi:MAG: phosphotransferase [Proteobacteria bacterium]|nr:phosphotransferase [Pseudomonadota bacterium]
MTSTALSAEAAARRHTFLFRQGLDPRGLAPLPGDASARRYYRLKWRGILLMEERPGAPDLKRFVTISRYLTSLGLSAPRIHALDQEAGLALIEDFGSQTFTRLFRDGHDDRPLYELAVDALVHLHDRAEGERPDIGGYGFGPLDDELEMFTDWYVPQCAPAVDAVAFKQEFMGLWHEVLSDISRCRDVLVLRDYHVDNLMVIAGRKDASRCGLLDFQDGVFGSAAYDLVSLTQDARRDLADGLEDHLVDHYLRRRPGMDRERFLAEYWLLAAHRHTKILGNFERLSKRDGKHGYLDFIPRVQGQLLRALPKAGLTRISALMERVLPGWESHVPTLPPEAIEQKKANVA